jgi:hypothetical protein
LTSLEISFSLKSISEHLGQLGEFARTEIHRSGAKAPIFFKVKEDKRFLVQRAVCTLHKETRNPTQRLGKSDAFQGTSVFRKVKAVKRLRGGVLNARRTSDPEDLHRDCVKVAFHYKWRPFEPDPVRTGVGKRHNFRFPETVRKP